MATAKIDVGIADPVSKSFRVTNTANQPREFKIRGKWFRWEPAGSDGDIVTISEAEYNSADFAAVIKYFHVAEVK